MPIPANLWLKDDGGALIRGSCDVFNREGSVEVSGFSHNVRLTVDPQTGKSTGTRKHAPVITQKEFDASSPYIYQAVSQGKKLTSAEFSFYEINDAGYFDHK